MPRARPIFPIAVSATQAATALKIPVRIIREAIMRGDLKAHKQPDGPRVRILVRSLEKWVESWPQATIKRQMKQ